MKHETGNNHRRKILCVEDHRDTCEILALVLRDYEFEHVNSLASARELIERKKYDLYILDNWLPDGSGVDLCKLIRLLDGSVPIIFTSGAGFKSDIENAMHCGADRYIVKPYEPLDLELIVKELLDRKTASSAES